MASVYLWAMLMGQAPDPAWSVRVSVASYHWRVQDASTPWVDWINGFNPGAGLVWRRSPRLHVTAGYFYNSDRQHSTYVLLGREWRVPFGAVGVEAGVVTGYDVPVLPAASPYVRIGPERAGVIVRFIPGNKPALAVQAAFGFGRKE